MRPMFRPIGTPLKQRPRAEECIDLTLRGVDGCLGEVRQTTGMIHVKMGQEDVLHISRVVPQSGNLPNSRLVRIKGAVHNACELANRGCRLCAIAHPPTCVNKDESVVGRDQQAMNDAVAALEGPTCAVLLRESVGPHGAAVEMVNLRCFISFDQEWFPALEVDIR